VTPDAEDAGVRRWFERQVANRVIRPVALTLLRIVFKVRIEGSVPREGCVIAGHHSSYFDGPLLGLVDRRVQPIYNRRFLESRSFGWFFRAVGGIPTRSDTLPRACEVIRAGGVVWIATAGFTPGEIQKRPRRGAARIVQETGAPLVPMIVRGLEGIVHIGDIRPRHFRRLVRIVLGQPLMFPEGATVAEITDAWLASIAGLREAFPAPPASRPTAARR
jgi:1-acyl-sn-glycerol-3-phosphate acyltransferase